MVVVSSSYFPDADICGRSNLSRASTLSSWFRFLEVFLLRRREAEPGERQGGLIIGGANATIAEAPWLVRLIMTTSTGSASCTGSIIDERHVLTAAHCIVEGSDSCLLTCTKHVSFRTQATPTSCKLMNVAQKIS